jgi:hypothetical protein
MIYYLLLTIISFEDISFQSVTCFRCIRAPDVTPYAARGKTYFYVNRYTSNCLLTCTHVLCPGDYRFKSSCLALCILLP